LDKRIKELRKALSLTQQGFADSLGTARNNIAGYETGRRLPSDAVISLICKTFNVSETWLRTGTGEMFSSKAADGLEEYARQHGATDLEIDILKAYFDLPADVRGKMLQYFKDRLTAPAKDQDLHSAADEDTADTQYFKEMCLELQIPSDSSADGDGGKLA